VILTVLLLEKLRQIVPEDCGEKATRSAVSRTTDINRPSDYVREVPEADIRGATFGLTLPAGMREV
jgi:hypothetical protein